MPSSRKEDELKALLISPVFKIRCLAIISRILYNETDALDVYDNTKAMLLGQNVEKVDNMSAFIRKAMSNQAKAFFKNKMNGLETTMETFDETPVTDSLFPHIEFSEIRKAVKSYRDETDFIIFELNSEGHKDKEISVITGIKYGTVRKRLSLLRDWIKKHFDGK